MSEPCGSFLSDIGANMLFCGAHLIRDVRFLTKLRDRVTRNFGEKLLASIKRLFRVWHRRDLMSPDGWRRAADRAERDVLDVVRRAPSRTS